MTALTLERRIRLMTAKQLDARIAEAEAYLHSISPRLSKYKELQHELNLLRRRYTEITAPRLEF